MHTHESQENSNNPIPSESPSATHPIFGFLFMIFIPPTVFLSVIIPRLYHEKFGTLPTAITKSEISFLFLVILITLIASVFIAADLKRAIERPEARRTVLRLATLEVVAFALILLAGYLSRDLLERAAPMPISVTTPIAICAFAWALLVGYVAKIPWDGVVKILIDLKSANKDPNDANITARIEIYHRNRVPAEDVTDLQISSSIPPL